MLDLFDHEGDALARKKYQLIVEFINVVESHRMGQLNGLGLS